MNFFVIISVVLFYEFNNVVPSFSVKEDGESDSIEVSIPLVEKLPATKVNTPLFKSISFIPEIVTVKNLDGKLEYEMGSLLLCEKTLDSTTVAFPLSNIRDQRIRGRSVTFDPNDHDETEIKNIISSELGDVEQSAASRAIPASYTEYIKYLLDKVTPGDDSELISPSIKKDGSIEDDSGSKEGYINILPLTIYLPSISDKYSDCSIMYVNITAPSLIQVNLDSFYNMECTWYIHSILQQNNDDGGMVDVTWGVPYINKINKSIVVSDPVVSLYKKPKNSFWRWFRSEATTIITSSNIHIMASGKYIVTYNHRCNTFAKPSNVVRTLNIEAFDVATSESSTS